MKGHRAIARTPKEIPTGPEPEDISGWIWTLVAAAAPVLLIVVAAAADLPDEA